MLAGIAVAADGAVYVSNTGGGGGWTPADLFIDGEQGAWYDPSDLSTMFQDTAGTIPVTAAGQTVARINDKSGRGNHATQATAAARPQYQTDGTYHWLEFDGVDDALSTAAINLSVTQQTNLCFGATIGNTNLGFVFEFSAVANSNAGTFNAYYNDGGLGGLAARVNANGSSLTGTAEVAVTVPNKSVYDAAYDLGTTAGSQAVSVRRNGAAYSTGGTNPVTANFGNYPMYLGARGGSSFAFAGNLYGAVLRGAASSAQEITDTETWMNSKTGAY